MRYELLYDVSNLYYSAGAIEQYTSIVEELEPVMIERLAANPRDFQRQYNPYVILRDIYENRADYQNYMNYLLVSKKKYRAMQIFKI